MLINILNEYKIKKFKYLIFLCLIIVIILSYKSLGRSKIIPSKIEYMTKKLNDFRQSNVRINSSDNCRKEYSSLYQNDTMKISIFLGAMDSNNDQCWDRAAKNALIEHLTQSCKSSYFACGFLEKVGQSNQLQKVTNDSKNIIINIHDSSVSDSFNKNTSSLLIKQKKKSKNTKNLFLKSLCKDDIVFYLGHSRYGTGPGFFYLPIFQTTWFSTYTGAPSLKDTIRVFKQTSAAPKIFGLLGCNSQRYYGKIVHSVIPNSALMLTTGVSTFDSQILAAVGVINAILGNQCYSHLNDAITKLNPTPVFRLYGLFKNNTFPQFKNNNGLFSITVFILMAPILIIFTSKLYPIKNLPFFGTKNFSKDIFYLSIFVIISFIATCVVINAAWNFCEIQFKQSVPFFFILSGAMLFIKYLYKNRTISGDVIDYYKYSLLPLLFSILAYFCLNLFSAGDLTEPIQRSLKFFLIFLLLFPFYIFTDGIIKFPLFAKVRLLIVNRIFLYFIISFVFNLILIYWLIELTIWIPQYKWWILLFFLYNQFISLLLYYYMSSTLFSAIYLTLSVSLIFSENIQGLVY